MSRITKVTVYLVMKDGVWSIQLLELQHFAYTRSLGLTDGMDFSRMARKLAIKNPRTSEEHIVLDVRAWKPADYAACCLAIKNKSLTAFAKERA